MKTFDVQSISIDRPVGAVFAYVANPANLSDWTSAFSRADETSADLVTPRGEVAIRLDTLASQACGTIDWKMTFPDGMVGWAYSRLMPEGDAKAIYSFVLLAPPVPLEMLEGALEEQMKTLANELSRLKARLEA